MQQLSWMNQSEESDQNAITGEMDKPDEADLYDNDSSMEIVVDEGDKPMAPEVNIEEMP